MLSTAAFLLMWTGFTALRGNPKYVYSNAATNLISAPVSEYRVKMMNSSVKHIHSGVKLTFHEFRVLLHKVSNFINNRPQGLDFDRQEG